MAKKQAKGGSSARGQGIGKGQTHAGVGKLGGFAKGIGTSGPNSGAASGGGGGKGNGGGKSS